MSKNEYMKFWPVAVVVLAFLGSAATFYFGMQGVAADVEVIKTEYARSNLVDLKFIIVENRVENLDDKVDDNENRTVKQLEDINGKLDKISDLLLKRVEADNTP